MPDLHSRADWTTYPETLCAMRYSFLHPGSVRTGAAGMTPLSTFSMSASTASAVVASVYVVISLVLGYFTITVGLRLGGQGSA